MTGVFEHFHNLSIKRQVSSAIRNCQTTESEMVRNESVQRANVVKVGSIV